MHDHLCMGENLPERAYKNRTHINCSSREHSLKNTTHNHLLQFFLPKPVFPLSLVCHLLGTPFSPDFKGSILFLEDVGEQPYKIDRYFAHLKQAGVFDKISGLILGEFLDCEDDDERSFTINDLIDQYFSKATFPVIKNFPYGHGDVKFSMPVGMDTTLDTDRNKLRVANPFRAN